MQEKLSITMFSFAAIILSVLLSFNPLLSCAQEQDSKKCHLIFFYNKDCPHCDKESLFLDKIALKYPELVMERHDVSKPGVKDKLMALSKQYNFTPGGVPVTFVGTVYFIGYDSDDVTGKQIENAIVKCINK
jgi:thiol-disulfide isomerase/thioredoxin